jgi:hypothetical protein
MYLDGSTLKMAITDANTEQTVASNTVIAANTWVHVAGTYDGTDLKVYLNGVEDNTAAYSGDIDGSAFDLFVGAEDNVGTSPYNGKMDMLRICDEPKTTFPKVLSGASAVDSTKAWTKDLYSGYTLKIVGGTGSGQSKRIIANDSTTLYVESNWSTPLDATSEYIITTGRSTPISVRYTLV